MFKVLSGQKRRRVISPATIAASVAAHLLLLGGLVYAASGPVEVVEVVCLDCDLPELPEEPRVQPPKPVEPKPAAPARTDEPAKAAAPVTVLEVPEVLPVKGIRPEAPDVKPVDPSLYQGDGPRGPVLVPPTPGPTEPSSGGGTPRASRTRWRWLKSGPCWTAPAWRARWSGTTPRFCVTAT